MNPRIQSVLPPWIRGFSTSGKRQSEPDGWGGSDGWCGWGGWDGGAGREACSRVVVRNRSARLSIPSARSLN